MTTLDPFNLNRFLGAQESSYEQALQEIRSGRKTSHWIWFIFPQIRGLGRSPMAENYGIASIDEARAYLAHPVLRERLIEISRALLRHAKDGLLSKAKSAEEILGYIDALKVRSSMTLFDIVEPDTIFKEVLDAFYNSERDEMTLNILNNNHLAESDRHI